MNRIPTPAESGVDQQPRGSCPDLAYRIERLTPAIGARVDGIDLTRIGLASGEAESIMDGLYNSLMQYKVLFFPDQQMTPAQHVQFAQHFGELAPAHAVYPHAEQDDRVTLLEHGPQRPPDTDTWHSDMTYRVEPPFAAVLHAREVPAVGGDTLWLSLAAAYQTMPQSMKDMVADLNAVHDMGSFRNDFSEGHSDPARLNEAMQEFGSAIHPVVRQHPVTREWQLNINRGFTNHIVGMQTQDSQRLLCWLFDHIERPEHQVRFRWSDNTLAIWDNRITQHYAVSDYLPATRRMHRVTVVKDRRLV